jgi:hypothetical protein
MHVGRLLGMPPAVSTAAGSDPARSPSPTDTAPAAHDRARLLLPAGKAGQLDREAMHATRGGGHRGHSHARTITPNSDNRYISPGGGFRSWNRHWPADVQASCRCVLVPRA